jgi:hypothetical protein
MGRRKGWLFLRGILELGKHFYEKGVEKRVKNKNPAWR